MNRYTESGLIITKETKTNIFKVQLYYRKIELDSANIRAARTNFVHMRSCA